MSPLASLMPLLGVPIQWLRAQKSIPEWVTVLVQIAIGSGAYWLGTGKLDGGVVATIGEVFGATQATSSLANMNVALIPRTNSK